MEEKKKGEAKEDSAAKEPLAARRSRRLNPSLREEANTTEDNNININTPAGDEEEVNNNNNNAPQRRSKYHVLIDDTIMQVGYVQYSNLSSKERALRELKVAKLILGICSNRKQLKEERMEYVRKNNELAGDALLLLDTVRARLQSIFCLNLDTEVRAEDALHNIMNNTTANRNEEKHYIAATSLLGESTKKGYNCMRNSIMTDFKIEAKDFPSYYHMTKFRPNFISFDVNPLESLIKFEHEDINATEVMDDGNDDYIPMNVSSATDFVGVGSVSIKMEDAMEKLTTARNKTIKACRIDGHYDEYIQIMAEKLEKPRGNNDSSNNSSITSNLIGKNSDIIVIDSYDGAEHQQTEKKEELVSLVFLCSC